MNPASLRWILKTALGCCLAILAFGFPPKQDLQAQLPKAITDKETRTRVISGGKVAVENALKFKTLFNEYGNRGSKNLVAMADGLETMSKLGKGLGMFGAGIGMGVGVAEMLGFVESDAAKMDRMLNEISGKIDKLGDNMNSRFDCLDRKLAKMESKIQAGFAKTQVFPFIVELDEVQDKVDKYYKALAEKNPNYEDIDDWEKALAKWDSNQIAKAVNAVESVVLGTNYASNMMEADYDLSNGDLGKLGETAFIFAKLVNQAENNFVLVKTLQLKRGDENDLKRDVPLAKDRVTRNPNHPHFKKIGPMSVKEVDSIVNNAKKEFDPRLDKISKELNKYVRRGVEERTKNVGDFLSENLLKPAGKVLPKIANTNREIHKNGPWEVEGTHATNGDDQGSGFAGGKGPFTKHDYEKKYGHLAQELKKKYSADFLVVVYHPIQKYSQDKSTGLVQYPNWNWRGGSNFVWFLERDPDYNGAGGSNLVFVMVKWTEFTADYPPHQAPLPFEMKTVKEWEKFPIRRSASRFSGIYVPWNEQPGLTQAELDITSDFATKEEIFPATGDGARDNRNGYKAGDEGEFHTKFATNPETIWAAHRKKATTNLDHEVGVLGQKLVEGSEWVKNLSATDKYIETGAVMEFRVLDGACTGALFHCPATTGKTSGMICNDVSGDVYPNENVGSPLYGTLFCGNDCPDSPVHSEGQGKNGYCVPLNRSA